MFQASNIRVVSLVIYETLGYSPMYRRAYEVQSSGHMVQALGERINRADRVTADTVVGLANDFLRPAANFEGSSPILIPDGWGASRCRFLLEVEYDFGGLGSKVREAFLGWTNTNGLSLQSNAIDPDMVFHLNSVSHMKVQDIPTLDGMQQHYSVLDTSHILANNNYGGAHQTDKLIRMRPDDLFATMQLSHLDTGGSYDDRTVMTSTAQKASRSSSIATNYMARTLDAYLAAARNQGDLGQDAPDVLENARARVHQTQSAASDPFLREISRIENGGQFIPDHFTYRTLCQIDMNTDRLAEVQMVPPVQRDSWIGSTNENDWSDKGIYTQVATILAQSVPTILMETGLKAVQFQSTNRKIGQRMETTITQARSFSEVFELNQQCLTFIDRVNREILTDLSYNGQLDYALFMQMSIHGEVVIEVSLNNDQNLHRYVAPLFADALTTPIVTTQFGLAQKNAELFGGLAGELSEMNLLGSATSTNIQTGSAGMAF